MHELKAADREQKPDMFISKVGEAVSLLTGTRCNSTKDVQELFLDCLFF